MIAPANKPQAEQTPAGPTYEGRLLPHPDEEVVDQGVQFDLGTLLRRRGPVNRRALFGVVGGGVAAATLSACGSSGEAADAAAATTTAPSASTASSASGSAKPSSSGSVSSSPAEIPEETNGPYPSDGSNGPDVLEQSGVIRQDLRSSFGTSTTTAQGVALTIEFTVRNLAKSNAPYSGVAVYAWHCDRDGNYSMYSKGVENENYLRGVQIADVQGKVSFTSIFPACYTGRWPHVHFEVYPDQASMTDYDKRLATSQLALPKEVCDLVYATTGYTTSVRNLAQVTLASDNVFSDDGAEHQLATMRGSVAAGYTAALTVNIDPNTEPSVTGGPGGASGGGPGGGGPGGGGKP